MTNFSQTSAGRAGLQVNASTLLTHFISFLVGVVVAMGAATIMISKGPTPSLKAPHGTAQAEKPSAPTEDKDFVAAQAARAQAARQLNDASEAAGLGRPYEEKGQGAQTYRLPEIDPNAPIDPALISSDRYQNMDRLTTYAVLIGRATGCRFQTGPLDDRVRKWIIGATSNSRADRDVMFAVWQAGIRENAYAQLEGRSPDDCDAVARGIHGHRWP
ncbi:MAG: hypothetical protein Q8Q88_23885 [Phenylobacterium sp.]|uniref:hypothetical protein n=1 Tax=Phenylobacterium sp. TaxID=1871053 RepID=UPI0027347DEB|nr:hypothetical protein [Phenylobacterium sp.]MDP3750077.1 hypothetical protein [Phenylobacterium sp.]